MSEPAQSDLPEAGNPVNTPPTGAHSDDSTAPGGNAAIAGSQKERSHDDYDDEDDEPTPFVVTLPDDPGASKDWLLWAGVMALLVVTSFFPAIYGTFLWDDDRHVSQNENLLTSEGLQHIWTDLRAEPQYYPLTHTVWWVEHYFWQLNPLGYHIVNMVLQALSAVLVWRILRRLGIPGAFVAAAIWAIHPLQAESVDWISELKNVLSGVLFFASIWFYLDFAEISVPRDLGRPAVDLLNNRWASYAVALVLFVAALLSKTTTCAMPAVMLVLLWQQRRLNNKNGWGLAPFFVIGLFMGLLTAHLETDQYGMERAIGSMYSFSFAQRILLAGRALWFYAGKLIFPWKLTFSYPMWTLNAANPIQWLFPIAAIAVVVVLWVYRQTLGRGPLAAVLWFGICLFPALGFFNIFPMRYSLVADHFQYLAGLGLITLICAAVANWLGEKAAREKLAMAATGILPTEISASIVAPRVGAGALDHPVAPAASVQGGVTSAAGLPTTASDAAASGAAVELPPPLPIATKFAVAISVVAVLAAAGLTWMQSQIYLDPETLWRDTIAKNDTSWMATFNLANELVREAAQVNVTNDPGTAVADLNEALSLYDRTGELKPDHENLHLERGYALMLRSKAYQQAASDLAATQASAASADIAAGGASSSSTIAPATAPSVGAQSSASTQSSTGAVASDAAANDAAANDQQTAGADQLASNPPLMTAAEALAQSKADAQEAAAQLRVAIIEANDRTDKPVSYYPSSLPNQYLGELLQQEGKYADAIPYLQKAIALADVPDPRTSLPQKPLLRESPRYLLAECYANLGQWRAAADQAGAGLDIYPNDDRARYDVATWLRNEAFTTKDKARRHDLLDQSEKQFAMYLLHVPTDPAGWYEIARVRMANEPNPRDLYLAGEYANQALQLNPGSPQIAHTVTQIRMMMEEARKQLLAASTQPSATQPSGAVPSNAMPSKYK